MGQPGAAAEVARELDRISQASSAPSAAGGADAAEGSTMTPEEGEQAVAAWLRANADGGDVFSVARPQEYAAAVVSSLVNAGYEVDEWLDELRSFRPEDLNAFIESVVQHYAEDGQPRMQARLQDRDVAAVEILAGVPWLSPVLDMTGGDEFLAALAAELEVRRVRVGEMIIRKGDIGTEMYFVADGCVDVRVSLDKPPVATLHVGSAFGESALLNDLPRNAFVVAATDAGLEEDSHAEGRGAESDAGETVQLLVLNKQGLGRAMSRFPTVEADMEEGSWLWRVQAQHEFYTAALEHE